MNKEKSIKFNFVMNTILTMSSFVYPLITFPYVSRIIMPAGTGAVSFATSVITYFNMFAQLGIPVYGIRACAKVRDDREELSRTAQELIAINLIMALLSYAVLGIAMIHVPRLQADRTLFLVMSSIILLSVIGVEWLYRALECYTYITVRSIVFKVIAVIAMFLLIHEPEDYVMYGAITVLAAYASYILNLINVHKYIDLKPQKGLQLRRHIRPVLVFFAMSCATTIYTNLDNVMLGLMKTNVDVGYYDAAVKIKIMLAAIVASLGAVLLPRASYYIESGRMEEFWNIMKRSLSFVWLFAPALVIYFEIFSEETILVLSGEKYLGAVMPMRVILPTVFFIGLSNYVGMQILVPLGKESVVLKSEIAGAVVDLLLNLMLIPKLGATGAAIGTLAAEFIVFAVQFADMRSQLIVCFKSVAYRQIIISTSAAVITALAVSRISTGPLIMLIISAVACGIVYCGALLLLKEPLVTDITTQIMKKIQYAVWKKETNNAGGKAKNDAYDIADKWGFTASYRPSDKRPIRVLQQVMSFRKFDKADMIFVQYPAIDFRLINGFLKHVKSDANSIALIHDLRSIQGAGEDDVDEIAILNHFKYVIAHNNKMAEFLRNSGYRGNIIELQLFDYLHDEERGIQDPRMDGSISFAGNLEKSTFIDNLSEITGKKFILYGNTGSKTLKTSEMVEYKGSLPSDEIVYKLEGDYGLVWDGDSIDTCSGTRGEYMRFNNPHKLSMCMAAGKPVITWKEAAIAGFVEDNGVGITVSSLRDLENIDLVSGYRQMRENALKIKKDIAAGRYLMTALGKCK